jgi:hypothetical protein
MELNITIELAADKLAYLKEMINYKGTTDAEYKILLGKYCSASIQEYISIIVGDKSFTKMQDINEYRLFLIIKNVFNGIVPSEQLIANLFQIKITTARTLLRNTLSKYQFELRSKLNDSLKKLVKSKTLMKNKKDYQILPDSIISVEELNSRLDSKDKTLPKIEKVQGTVSAYIIKKSSYAALESIFGP